MTIVFSSRRDAAHRLARALAQYRGGNALVRAIPRGAVAFLQVEDEEVVELLAAKPTAR